jgi:uncharacterized membrane protein YiaA
MHWTQCAGVPQAEIREQVQGVKEVRSYFLSSLLMTVLLCVGVTVVGIWKACMFLSEGRLSV